MRCLFLAPMKPPDDPTPSGDRLIARQFMTLLGRLGCEVELAAKLRTRCREPADLGEIQCRAEAEIDRILAAERGRERPAFVLTYHNYYRAPDLIGPALADALSIPYVIAESSRAPKRAIGDWAAAHALAERASDAADLIFASTRHDLAMLEAHRPPHQTIVLLPPFLDRPPATRRQDRSGPSRLVTVAMMRAGNKRDSYLALASILKRIAHLDWTIDIVGDGPAREEIEARFAGLGARTCFHGAFDDAQRLDALLGASDIFVWPAIEEPIGMVFLEAQAAALPCIAYGYRGVPDVVADGIAGRVIAPGDEAGFSEALAGLIADRTAASRLGLSALRSFDQRHSMEAVLALTSTAFREAGITLNR